MNRRATYGVPRFDPRAPGVTHPPDARWGRWGRILVGPASARRDFSRSKRGGRKKGSAIPRRRINKRETLYKTSPPEVVRDSPIVPSRRDLDLSASPSRPFHQLSSPLAALPSHSSDRQPTFPTSPERHGHYGVTRRNTFPASNVLVCARTERRVTRATRWEEIHD